MVARNVTTWDYCSEEISACAGKKCRNKYEYFFISYMNIQNTPKSALRQFAYNVNSFGSEIF